MRLIPALAVLSLLAACTQEPAQGPDRPEPPASPTVLGGVDLGQPVRALGTEPFWGVDIAPAGITYSGVDRPEQTAPNPGPTVTGTVAAYTTQTTQGNTLEITLIATECSDGMSDRTYPLTARVVIGSETLQGCAASTAAVMSAGESGPVQ